MKFVLERSGGRALAVPEPLASGGAAVSIGRLSDYEVPPTNPDFSYSASLQSFLHGKQLLLDEIPFSLEVLHEHYLHGYLTYSPGIVEHNAQLNCQRCGNHVQRLFASFSCARCGEECFYCRKCLMMGRVSMCTPLVSWCGPEPVYAMREGLLAWQGQLSQGQQRASDEVVAAVGAKKELLVWAVCGAGKTEVLFHGMEEALRRGQRVCMASPRTDVILELVPRFRKAFPDTEMIALYGGSGDRGKQAQLVLSTTHQLLRYKEAFDFIVIDEVDAFPFHSDETLHYAVQKARKPGASVIYLSATPDSLMKKRFRKGELEGIRIPMRYHGHPLPVPAFYWCGNWKKGLEKQKLPEIVLRWAIEKCRRKRQGFLFVPTVQDMEKVTELLRKVDERILGVHSEDAQRREKVEQFRDGEVPIIVTTTILERGVTVPETDVAVFGADDPVFSEQALVQMAGRVGRSAAFPEGDVLFFHNGRTRAMAGAKKHIEAMNLEAFPKERR
ncbi:MAG TPA: DEAD/DEAH box helicase [Bacillales bacterium]|nr:DEAD/DEAH box helicase [Bacillales bacterium]